MNQGFAQTAISFGEAAAAFSANSFLLFVLLAGEGRNTVQQAASKLSRKLGTTNLKKNILKLQDSRSTAGTTKGNIEKMESFLNRCSHPLLLFL